MKNKTITKQKVFLIEKDGKFWGVAYDCVHFRVYDFIDNIFSAQILDPMYDLVHSNRTVNDIARPYDKNHAINEKLKGARIVEATISVKIPK